MSFPASLTTRTVKGRFVTYPAGTPAKGKVRIVLNDMMQGPTDDVFVAPFDTDIKLDANGEFSVILPATNDPQWTSSYYRVTITADDKVIRSRFEVPYNDTEPLDLADALNLPASTPGESYILLSSRGAAGGVAALGSDGKVPAGQLPAASGGTVHWADIPDKPSTFPHDEVTYAQVTNKPSLFPPVDHDHLMSSVTGLTSALAGKAATVHTHATGDVTGLDTALKLKADLVDGLIPTSQIPDLSVINYLGPVASQSAMLALVGQKGDWCIRADLGKTYVISGTDPTQLSSWTALPLPSVPVQSVNGEIGDVVLDKADIGIPNVDNTSDANKPVSTAQQTALDLKANLASPTFTGTVGGITKGMVGLSSVDNTADTAKPVSTAQQTALDLKANLASPTFTGTVAGITKSMVGLGNVDNVSAANLRDRTTHTGSQPISTITDLTTTLADFVIAMGNVYDVTRARYGFSTSNTAAANATILQTAIDDAVTTGHAVFVPSGRYLCAAITANQGVTLLGELPDIRVQDKFGSSQWNISDRTQGTWLLSNTLSGTFLDISPTSTRKAYVGRMGLLGPGLGSSTGLQFVASQRLRSEEIFIANFSRGAYIHNTYFGDVRNWAIYGCDVGLHLNGVNNLNFYNLDLEANQTNALLIENCAVNRFFGGVTEVNSGTPILFDLASSENIFYNWYFEDIPSSLWAGANVTSAFEIKSGCDYNGFQNCHWPGTGTSPGLVRGNHTQVLFPQGPIALDLGNSYNGVYIGTFVVAPTYTANTALNYIMDFQGQKNTIPSDIFMQPGKKVYFGPGTNYGNWIGRNASTADTEINSASSQVKVNQMLRAAGFANAFVAKTANYTLTATDGIVTADSTSSAFTLTLPTAVGISGRIYTLFRINAGVNVVTVATTSSQTIGGSTTFALTATDSILEVVSDGANWRILKNPTPNVVNVRTFGAVGDGRRVTDAAMTATSATLTSATAAFTSADVGKRVVVWHAGTTTGSYTAGVAQQLDTTISAYVDATTVTLTNAAVTTVSGARATIATDDSAAINAAIATLTKGKELQFPGGTTGFYFMRNRITPPANGITVSGTSKAVEVHISNLAAPVPAVDAIDRDDITVKDITFVSEDGHIWTTAATSGSPNYRGDGQVVNHAAVWCNGNRLTVKNVHSADYEETVYLSPWSTSLATFAQDGRRADCNLEDISSVDQFCTVLAESTIRLKIKNISKVGYVSAYGAPGHAFYHSGSGSSATNYPDGLYSVDLTAHNISMVDDTTSGGGTVSLKWIRGGSITKIYARNNPVLYSIQLDQVKIDHVLGVAMVNPLDVAGQTFFCVESVSDAFGTGSTNVDIDNVRLGVTSAHAGGGSTLAFFHGTDINIGKLDIATYADSGVSTTRIRDLNFWGDRIRVDDLRMVNLAGNDGGSAIWPFDVGATNGPGSLEIRKLSLKNWRYAGRIFSLYVTDLNIGYNPANLIGIDNRATTPPFTSNGGTFTNLRLQLSEYTKELSITGSGQTVVPSPALETTTQINATTADAFTIGAPSISSAATLVAGSTHRVSVRNATAGTLGAITWNAAWNLRSTFVAPPAGETHIVTFVYNGTTWRETNRSSGAASSISVTGSVTSQLLAVTGLTGAVTQGRFVGGTVSGAPTTGTFAIGDYVVSNDGNFYICTSAGTPGTWVAVGTPAALNSLASDALTVGEVVPNRDDWSINTVSPVSGGLVLTHFTADKSEAINTLTLSTGSVAAAATPTLIRYAVYSVASNGDLTLVASTVNDTTLLTATNTDYPKALSSTWNKVVGNRYAVGVLVVTSATMPNFQGRGMTATNTLNVLTRLAPMTVSRVLTQTDLPSTVDNASIVGWQQKVGVRMS